MLRHPFLCLRQVSPSPSQPTRTAISAGTIVGFSHQRKHQLKGKSTFVAKHQLYQPNISNPPPQPRKMADMADEIADRLEGTSLRGAGRGGQRGRGGRGGAKGRGVDLSRALTRLLRHQAGNAGIQLDSEGYAPLELVVSLLFVLLFALWSCLVLDGRFVSFALGL